MLFGFCFVIDVGYWVGVLVFCFVIVFWGFGVGVLEVDVWGLVLGGVGFCFGWSCVDVIY